MNLRTPLGKASALVLLYVGCGPNIDVLSTRDAGAIAPSVGGAETVATGGSPVAATGGSPVAATGGSPVAATGGSPVAATGGSPVAATGGSPVAATGGSPIISTSGTEIDASTSVTLERTSYFGPWPVYSVNIRGDGLVSYHGQTRVNVLGNASRQIPVADVQSLVDTMVLDDYFELSVPAACAQGIVADAPIANTSVTLNGQSHSVLHDSGNSCAPPVLTTLENLIDSTAQTSEWVRCDSSNPLCGAPQGTGGAAGIGGAGSVFPVTGGVAGLGGAGTAPATGRTTSVSTTKCECKDVVTPCPDNVASCVKCLDLALPAECSECPFLTTDGPTCSTLGLHCSYGIDYCDCIVGSAGANQWDCAIHPF